MNKLDIVEGGHYKVQGPYGSEYTQNLYIIKKVKVHSVFGSKDGIVYSNFGDGAFEATMTVKDFNKIALYQVI